MDVVEQHIQQRQHTHSTDNVSIRAFA